MIRKRFPANHQAVGWVTCPVCFSRPGKPCVTGAYGKVKASNTHKGRVDRFLEAQRAAKKSAPKEIPIDRGVKEINAEVTNEEIPAPLPAKDDPSAA